MQLCMFLLYLNSTISFIHMWKLNFHFSVILALHVCCVHVCPCRRRVSVEQKKEGVCEWVRRVHRFVHMFFQGWLPVSVTAVVNSCLNDLIRYSLCKYLGLPTDFHWLYKNASQMEPDKLMRNANISLFKWLQSRAAPVWLMRTIDCEALCWASLVF